MEGLSDFALKSVFDEIEERMREAKAEIDSNGAKEYYQGYYEAFFECLEIIKNRKDW